MLTKNENIKDDHFYVLKEIDMNLDNIIKNKINKIMNSKNRNLGIFNNFPIEILDEIFNFVDFKNLLPLKLVCQLFNDLINEYIKKYITYCLEINVCRKNRRNLYMMIYCDNCKDMKNNYINERSILNRINIIGCKCKYKKCEYNPNYINFLEIKYTPGYLYDNIYYTNDKLEFIKKDTTHYFIEDMEYINNIYTNSKIIKSKLFLTLRSEDDDGKNTKKIDIILKKILKIILSNTIKEAEIYFLDYIFNVIYEDVYVRNLDLENLIISKNLLFLKLELPNLNKLQLQNKMCKYDITKSGCILI